MRTEDIAEIISGYSLRGRIEDFDAGEVPVVQLTDVDPVQGISHGSLPQIQAERIDLGRYLIHVGDILIRSRGRLGAALADERHQGAIAAAPLFIIRIREDHRDTKVVPGFLNWWLNSASTLGKLDALTTATSVPYVRRDTLADLDINLPPIEVQKRIAEIDSLRKEEERLHLALIEQRRSLFSGVQALLATGNLHPNPESRAK